MTFYRAVNIIFVIIHFLQAHSRSVSSVSGPEMYALVGSQAILKCEKDLSVRMHWFKRGESQQTITYGDDIWIRNSEGTDMPVYSLVDGTYNLKISNLQIENSGLYECVFHNGSYSSFTPKRYVTLIVQNSIVECSVSIGNEITVSSETSLYSGQYIRYHCFAYGHGNASVDINITDSSTNITEYLVEEAFNYTEVQSDKLMVENKDRLFNCHLGSETVATPCEIKLSVLVPEVDVQPRSAEMNESTEIVFSCFGNNFKTSDLNFEWLISPPSVVASVKSSVNTPLKTSVNASLSIKSISRNDKDVLVTVTCTVTEGSLAWNSSSKLTILSNPESAKSSTTAGIVTAVISVVLIVILIIFVVVFLRYRCGKNHAVNTKAATHSVLGYDDMKKVHAGIETLRDYYPRYQEDPCPKLLSHDNNPSESEYDVVNCKTTENNQLEKPEAYYENCKQKKKDMGSGQIYVNDIALRGRKPK